MGIEAQCSVVWMSTRSVFTSVGEAAKDYDKVKIALMKRYDLTEDSYRHKFMASKPEVDESLDQLIVRLDRYLLRWLELSDTAQTFDGPKRLDRERTIYCLLP